MPREPESPIVSAIAAFVRRRGLLPPGARVAAAVSGGSDSVALFRGLLALEPWLGVTCVGVIHVNHQLRGAEAEADEQFCRMLAQAQERRVHVERVDVRRTSSDGRRQSPEDAARHARYAALDRGASALGADHVALGHTEDDQAETVLFRAAPGRRARRAFGDPGPARTVRPAAARHASERLARVAPRPRTAMGGRRLECGPLNPPERDPPRRPASRLAGHAGRSCRPRAPRGDCT